jgi:hypothetical protein
MLSFSISYPYLIKLSWLCAQQQPGGGDEAASNQMSGATQAQQTNKQTGHDFYYGLTPPNLERKKVVVSQLHCGLVAIYIEK